MAAHNWDRNAVKNQLRWTCQRLGQIQEKNDSQGSITRRDISTLLQQNNVSLARAKAQKLVQEDVFGDILEIMGMYTGVLLEHINELDQATAPSPVVVEAASTLIFAASHVDVKDLHIVRDLLVQHFGDDFAPSASNNRDHYVSPRAIASLTTPTPSAADLDMYLLNIAKSYSVKWVPEPRRQDVVNQLSEILDSTLVDVPRLRQLCARGIPDHPSWLRPRIWKLFFGILPVLKANWEKEITSQRNSYYELVRRLLAPLQDDSPPSIPSSAQDKAVLDVSHQLSRIPPALFSGLADEPEASSLCPLDDSYSGDDKITYGNSLQRRLQILQSKGTDAVDEASAIPEIRLEFEAASPESPLARTSSLSKRVQVPPVLVSKSLSDKAHSNHMAALARILYIHSAINPGNMSPHVPTLLLPIYSVMLEEIELADAAHVEADTFWLFEALVGEFSELEDEQGGSIWMKQLSERLSWADIDLFESLDNKGLNPALPHYSYRWLAPLLAHTFPMSDILVAWDAIFSREARLKNSSPRLEFLVDICTAMLLRARIALMRLGKNVPKSPGLWGHEDESLPPPSPLRAWELGDAFLEGTALLQNYSLSGSGGIDSVLQSAADLWNRRRDEAQAAAAGSMSLGARLKVSMWKGFTNQAASPDRSPNASDGEEEQEIKPLVVEQKPVAADATPAASTLTSRLATTVWRGITNQSSMEPPPSPLSPTPEERTPCPEPEITPADGKIQADSSNLPATTRLWDYAEKLKDSDTAAAFAKASSNWRAKALSGSWGLRKTNTSSNSPDPVQQLLSPPDVTPMKSNDQRRGSLPGPDRTGIYSPPTRPAFFKPPRDSVIFPAAFSAPTSPEAATHNESESISSRTKHLQDSIASLTRGPTTRKSGPRPLLLNATSLITERSSPVPTNPRRSDEWAEVNKSKTQGHVGRQDSVSSISSLAPSLRSGAQRVDYESDGTRSRRVMLNRKSVSPMAPSFRAARHTSYSSSGTSPRTSPDRGMQNLAFSRGDIVLHSNDGPGAVAQSPSLYSPPLQTTQHSQSSEAGVLEPEIYQENGFDPSIPLEAPSHPRKLVRKKTPPTSQYSGDTSDSSVAEAPPKIPRPSALRLQETNETTRPHSKSLDVPWPDEEAIFTPKASSFEGDATSPTPPQRRKLSSDGHVGSEHRVRKTSTERRVRKISTESRTRKVSTETYRASRKTRESAAEEGDDEGYDDLLSAYESEEGSKTFR
ncbi:hypothetical protein BDZ89DRAFT_1107262 [Hymenopellis radicata]|nr:hypothetical protein BDZ89DRAFT_1107262 [Hymenopellis radicata]